MRPLQICIGPTIRIGRESWCLPYAGFFLEIINWGKSYPDPESGCTKRSWQSWVSCSIAHWTPPHTSAFSVFLSSWSHSGRTLGALCTPGQQLLITETIVELHNLKVHYIKVREGKNYNVAFYTLFLDEGRRVPWKWISEGGVIPAGGQSTL